MLQKPEFVDLNCHILPNTGLGPRNWSEAKAMLHIAARDGITRMVATTEQSSIYVANDNDTIRNRVAVLQEMAESEQLPIRVLPGAKGYPDHALVDAIRDGQALTLGDQGKFCLIEMPRALFLPLEPLVTRLASAEVDLILSQPERNRALQERRELAHYVAESGVRFMLTGASLLGAFGPDVRDMAQWLLRSGLVHFVATGAQTSLHYRPLMQLVFSKVEELTDDETALTLCVHNPGVVFEGGTELVQPRSFAQVARGWWPWRKAG